MFAPQALFHRVYRAAALLVASLPLGLAACGGGSGSGNGSDVNQGSTPTAPLVSALPAVPGWPQFTYPTSGQLSVEATHAFTWSSVDGSQGYQLQVGTSAGGSDVYDSGVVTATSMLVPKLPTSRTLYARVRAIPVGWSTEVTDNFPRGSYVTFRADSNVTGATFTSPSSGAPMDADAPIAWQPDPLARSYRLTIGSTVGGSDLLDSGGILSPVRVVPGLPTGATVYATLYTNYAGNITRTQSASFVVGNPETTTAAMLTVVRDLAGMVRGMADVDNQPFDGTVLAGVTAQQGDVVSDCASFTSALLQELSYARVPVQARELAVCFNTDSFDCHALVEVLDTDTQRWITIDPTFGLYALNGSGQPATSAEISTAARARAFDQLSFSYLTPSGAAYAHAYYIDYPLLFLNVYQPGSETQLVQPAPTSLQPYFDLMGPAVSGTTSGFYAAQCASGFTSSTAQWDGTNQTYACNGKFTPIFWGISVSVIAGNSSTAAIWRTHRFVF